jgi:hypothetical protein
VISFTLVANLNFQMGSHLMSWWVWDPKVFLYQNRTRNVASYLGTTIWRADMILVSMLWSGGL